MGVSKGNDLTEKQRRFCQEYMKDLNATQAYHRAGYAVQSSASASANSIHLLGNHKVQEYLAELVEERSQRTAIEADEVLRRLYRSAFSDIRDFVQWKTKNVRVHTDDGEPVYDSYGNPVMHSFTDVELVPMDEIDGQDVAKIKQGRYGLEVERVDPLKSRELLGKHLKLFTERHDVEHSGQVQVNFEIPRPPIEEE